MTIVAVIVGALLRVLYGMRGLKYYASPFIAVTAMMLAHESSWFLAAVTGLCVLHSFNPEHGDWMDAGQATKPDDGFLAPFLRLLGPRDGTVLYDCVGLGIRYLLATLFISIPLAFSGQFNAGYALSGALVGSLGWIKSWRIKEGIIGAIVIGGLAWV